MMKLMNILPILGANGPGKADGSGSGVTFASGIAEFIAGLAKVLSGLVSLVWGWLMSLLYFVIKLVLNVMDVLQFFVNKLVGIDIYNNPNWADIITFRDSDMIIKLITSETILRLFRSVLIFSAVLLILFCIIAILKSNFSSAMGNEEEKEGHAQKVMKKAAKSIFMCFIIPFILIIGILGSNVVLASICNAIKGNNDLTIGGIIFTTSSYDANKYRVYAKADQRVPIYYERATEIINPKDYRSEDDMRALFYYMAKGDIYIGGISENMEEKKANGDYNEWYSHITGIEKEKYSGLGNAVEDLTSFDPVSQTIEFATSKIKKLFEDIFSDETGNGSVATAFEEDFRDWYSRYFLNTPLNDMNLSNSVIGNIYLTNWHKNWTVKATSAEFGSTYYVAGDNLYFNSTGATVDILANALSYQNYEKFVTQQVEYYVMADLLDYAIEHNKQFYFVNADNTFIQWSDIQIGDDPEDKININEYADNYAVFSYVEDGVVNYYTYYGSLDEESNNLAINPAIEEDGKLIKRDDGQTVTYTKSGTELTLLSTNSFYVSYYDGTNRLYWSEDDKNSEREGATYIICTRNEAGYFVPVTQTTTSFRSNFLNSNYGGPIVARGIFDKTSVIPQEYQQPTAIREQLVDDEGNEVSQLDPSDSKSLKIVYSPDGNPVSGASLSNFIGYTHGPGETLVETMETPIIVGTEGTDSMIRGSISNLTVQQCDDFSYVSIGSGDYEKLYVNRYIKGYTQVGNVLKLYDNQGYAMTWGGDDGNEYENEFAYSITREKDVYLYYIATKTSLYHPIISYEELDSGLLGDYWATLTELNARNATVYGFDRQIIIRYKAKLVSFMPQGMNKKLVDDGADESTIIENSQTMIIGAEAVGVSQYDAKAGNYYNNQDFVVSGTFEIPKFEKTLQIAPINLVYNNAPNYNIPISGDRVFFYKTELTNLYVKNGEVYYGDGDLFYGTESATKLFDHYGSNYTSYTKLEIANLVFDILYGENKSAMAGYVDNFKASLQSAIGTITDHEPVGISPEDIYKHLSDNDVFANVRTLVYSLIHGQDFLIGLASGVQKLDPYYIGYKNKGEDVIVSVYAKNSTPIEERNASIKLDENGDPIKDENSNPIKEKVNINDITNTIKEESSSYGKETRRITMPITVVLKSGSDKRVEAVLVNPTRPYYDGDNAVHNFTLTFDVTFSKVGGYAFAGSISNMELDANDHSRTMRQYIEVKNGAVYCDTLLKTVLTIDALKQFAIESLRGSVYGVSNYDGMFDFHTLAEANNRYIYFERGNFGYNFEVDFTFHAKSVLVLPVLVIRLYAQLVRTYAIEVLYRLEGGGFLLNYNFNQNTGIAIGNLFEMRNMNPLIFVFATGLIFSMLWNMVWALIKRIYVIGIRFVILPGVLAVDVLDDGKFKSWKDAVIENIFAAYSTLIMLNLYFALIPSISDLTAGLITWKDLPTTFTGLFANIGIGTSNMGLKVGNMVGSIGTNLSSITSLIAPQLLDLSQSTIITITDWLNRLIFMMFFLVLTTLVKQGKDLLGDFVGSKADLDTDGGNVRKGVDELKKSVKDGPVGKTIDKLQKISSSNLAHKVSSKAFSGLTNLIGGQVAGSAGTRAFTSLDAAGNRVGGLSGSNHATSAPTSVNIRGGRNNGLGAGGRVIPIEMDDALLGAGGGAPRINESREETREATVFDSVTPSMTQQDEPDIYEAPRPIAYYAGSGMADGMSFDIEPEKLVIDFAMSSSQLHDKANEHSESASTNRGLAEAARELAEEQQEVVKGHTVKRDDLLAQVEALEEQIAEAKAIAAKAYELKQEAQKNGQRTDKVVDAVGVLGTAGAVVDADKVWGSARADVNTLQATLDAKKEALNSAEDELKAVQEQHEILIAKAEQYELEAERDDRFHAEYLEAAQQKEQEEAAATKGDLAKLGSELEVRMDDIANSLRGEFEEIEVPVDDFVAGEEFKNLKQNIGNQAAEMYGEIDALSEELGGKADAALTEQAINTKADAGVVKDIANAAGVRISTKGKHEGDVVKKSSILGFFGVDTDEPVIGSIAGNSEPTENGAATRGQNSGNTNPQTRVSNPQKIKMNYTGLANAGVSAERYAKTISDESKFTLDALKQDKELLAKEMQAYAAAIEKQQKKLDSTEAKDAKERKHLTSEISNNEGELSSRREKLAEAEAIIAELEGKTDERDVDSKLEAKYQAAIKKRNEMTAKIKTQEEEIEAMKTKVAEIDNRRNGIAQQIESEQKILSSLHGYDGALDNEIAKRGNKPTDPPNGGGAPNGGGTTLNNQTRGGRNWKVVSYAQHVREGYSAENLSKVMNMDSLSQEMLVKVKSVIDKEISQEEATLKKLMNAPKTPESEAEIKKQVELIDGLRSYATLVQGKIERGAATGGGAGASVSMIVDMNLEGKSWDELQRVSSDAKMESGRISSELEGLRKELGEEKGKASDKIDKTKVSQLESVIAEKEKLVKQLEESQKDAESRIGKMHEILASDSKEKTILEKAKVLGLFGKSSDELVRIREKFQQEQARTQQFTSTLEKRLGVLQFQQEKRGVNNSEAISKLQKQIDENKAKASEYGNYADYAHAVWQKYAIPSDI